MESAEQLRTLPVLAFVIAREIDGRDGWRQRSRSGFLFSARRGFRKPAGTTAATVRHGKTGSTKEGHNDSDQVEKYLHRRATHPVDALLSRIHPFALTGGRRDHLGRSLRAD